MNRLPILNRRLAVVAPILALVLALAVALMPASASAAPAAAPEAGGVYHVVQRGETLSHIARHYGVTIESIKDVNHLWSNTIYVGQHLYIPAVQSGYSTGCSSVHHVRRGETLSSIARAYGTTYASLAAANGISNASYIYAGQRICIPNIYAQSGWTPKPQPDNGCYYTVRRGDTLSEIAQWYGYSTDHLARANGIAHPSHIYVGQQICVCN
ncbi:MAG: LysM peptidoglycan-binding domain-containing protein [Caldilineaceae bacterium]|nr:LysM peptidoglycan-binding domain-containing protein [Caldilineaceae bacterium]